MLGKSGEKSAEHIKEIENAPLPSSPVAFQWHGPAVVSTVAVTSPVIVIGWMIVYQLIVDPRAFPNYWPLPVLMTVAAAGLTVNICVARLLMFILKGPAVVLSPNGVFCKGKITSWQDIDSVRIAQIGRTSGVSFFLKKEKWRGYFSRKIVMPCQLVRDYDGLVAYSRKYLQETDANTAALLPHL